MVAIMLVTLPPEAFDGFEKTTNAEALKRQGLTLETLEPMPLSIGKALLVVGGQVVQNIKLHKWFMMVSTPEFTALVSVQIPDSAAGKYSDATLRTALASLAVRAQVPVEEQLSQIPFKVGELAGFHVGGVMAGRAVLLTDAPDGVAPSHQPQIVVAVANGGPTMAADRENFARDIFDSTPNLKDVRIVSAEPLRIGGQPGHQIMARGKESATGEDVTIVQWLRFGTGGYMHLIGVARTGVWTQSYARFRQVRDGIELR
jgi:hypothetical protein